MKGKIGVSHDTVLLVEDHKQFRTYIRDLLEEHQNLRIVGEAEDGVTAVDRCLELQPDFVLLDIGLPKLNGFQVARRIRQSAPGSRIVFLTQESSAEMAHEALSLGAAAYVIKAHTAGDLIPALLAARDGRSFVSPAVRGFDSLLHPVLSNANSGSPDASPSSSSYSHQLHFYNDHLSFLVGLSSYVEGVLNAGKAFLAVLLPEDNRDLIRSLRSRGINTEEVIARRRLVLMDSSGLSAQYLVNGRLDSAGAWSGSVSLVEMMKSNNPGIAICAGGQWAPVLLAQGNQEAALQIERIWDRIARLYNVEVFCAYVTGSSQNALEIPLYRQVSAIHSLVRSY